MRRLTVFRFNAEVRQRIKPSNINVQTGLFGRFQPSALNQLAYAYKIASDIMPLVFADCCQRRRRTDSLSPVGAADKAALGCLHHLAATNDSRHGIAIPDRFSKYR